MALYPSAMVRIANELGGFLKGLPKVISERIISMMNSTKFEDWGKKFKWDGYFVDIKILSFGKQRNFPLGPEK